MISWLATILVPYVGDKVARPLAIVGLVIAAIPLVLGAKAIYDHNVVKRHTDRANAEQLEKLNSATGDADVASDARGAEHNARVKTTEEMIDEALEKGCAVGEYLASGGTNCVR